MAASITKAGESLIAQKQGAKEVLRVVRFVLAQVPDLDFEGPVDRDALKPPPEQIVHVQNVAQEGYINPNQVVYSLMMGSDVGDFDWNWIGLETEEDVLLSVAYVPTQQKRKNIPPHQIGNNVTRNFLVMFDGAQALTQITIDASTWQHDFTVRLKGIDERERLSNRDLFGRFCCFGVAFRLGFNEGQYHLGTGIAYVEGIRLLLEDRYVIPDQKPVLPTAAWLDVAMIRSQNTVKPEFEIRWAAILSDYVDNNGVQHYCVPIADLQDTKTIFDLRVVEPVDRPLVSYFAARKGDYAELRARATTKADVGLDQLPNAKSDDPATNSSNILATTAALNRLAQRIDDSMIGMVAAFSMTASPAGWLKCNGAQVSRTTYAALFAKINTIYGAGDGSTTFTLPDFRGEFIRGWDDGRAVDPDRLIGSNQAGQNAFHAHSGWVHAAGSHAHAASTYVHEGGNHTHTFNYVNTPTSSDNPGIGAAMHQSRVDWKANNRIDWAGSHGHGASTSIAPDGSHVHGLTINGDGGDEARPRNVALLICIKY